MATVILTDSVKDSIVTQLRSTFNKRLEESRRTPPELTAEAFIDRWVERNNLRTTYDAAFAAGWFDHNHSIYVNTPDGGKLTLNFTVRTPCPEAWVGYNTPLKMSDDAVGMAAWHGWQAARKEMEKEVDAAVNTVRALLNRHRTLKSAIQEWSPLENLLTSELRERYFKVVERSKPAPKTPTEYPELNLDAVAGSLVVNRITGA